MNSGNANFDNTWKSLGVFQLVSNLDINWQKELFLSFIFVKFSFLNNSKYGVVVEGPTIVQELDGPSPGHDSFEKVINFFQFGFILSFLIELKT